jgi:hypothetical protein
VITRALQKLVHVGCRELGIDADTRRDLQKMVCGKASLADMTEHDHDTKANLAATTAADPTLIVTQGWTRVLWRRKGKELIARMAPFPASMRLQERADTLLCAIGADVMCRLGPVVVRFGNQYESAPGGAERLIASLKIKAAIRLYHLSFRLQKRIRQRQLRKLGIDQLLVQLRAQFGDLFDRHPVFGGIADKLPDLFAQIDAASDQAERTIRDTDHAIKVHWTNPRQSTDSRKG